MAQIDQQGGNFIMTELEKTQRAQTYIEKLANGIDPLTDFEIPTDSVLNNIRISRCLFYVSDILKKVIENGGAVTPVSKSRRSLRIPFSITPEEQLMLKPLPFAVGPARLSHAINETLQRTEGKLSAIAISNFLVQTGFLERKSDPSNSSKTQITASGMELGIFMERRNGSQGYYDAILYPPSVQQFIIDHLHTFVNQDKSPS